MAICLTFGTHDFHGKMKGYENVTAQCHNCHNWSAQCVTEWPFFTICFIPLIPLACGAYNLVACPICNFKQDIVARPDVQSQGQGGGGHPPPGHPPPGQGQWGPPQGPPGQGQWGPPPGPYGQPPNK